jgi:hypothetical protein
MDFSFDGIKTSIASMARRSASGEMIGLDMAESFNLCQYRLEQLKKRRLWVPLILCVMSVAQLGNFGPAPLDVVKALALLVFFGFSAISYYIWASAKILEFSGSLMRLSCEITDDPHARSTFMAQKIALDEKIAKRAEQNEVTELRRQLQMWYQNAADAEDRGNFSRAGYCRGKAGEVESMLRQRGA